MMRAFNSRPTHNVHSVLSCVVAVATLVIMQISQASPSYGLDDTRGAIGNELYAHPEALAVLPIGVHTHQSASTDPAGNNHDFDHCQKIVAGNKCVLASHHGPGEVDNIWITTDRGFESIGNLTIALDGKTVIHQPYVSLIRGHALTTSRLTFPTVASARQSSGGTYIHQPMTFHSSMIITTDHDPKYYHVSYRTFDSSANVPTYTTSYGPAISRPQGGSLAHMPELRPHHTSTLLDRVGSGYLTRFTVESSEFHSLSFAQQQNVSNKVYVQVEADGRRQVYVSLADFFGGFPAQVSVHSQVFEFVKGPVTQWSSTWPMPFGSRIKVSLVNHSSIPLHFSHRYVIQEDPTVTTRLAHQNIGYFHAATVAGDSVPGKDFVFFTDRGRGKLVGISSRMRGVADDSFLEGNEHIYYDGASHPQIDGTGTEDLYEGGWYFKYGAFSDPFNGAPLSTRCGKFMCVNAYRIYYHDSIAYNRGIVAAIEHGPVNNRYAHYIFTNFWYSTR